MLNELEQVKPADIEKRSFEIITEELGDKILTPGTEPIVKRCIHTSADFDYADNLVFSGQAVEKALAAIRDRISPEEYMELSDAHSEAVTAYSDAATLYGIRVAGVFQNVEIARAKGRQTWGRRRR